MEGSIPLRFRQILGARIVRPWTAVGSEGDIGIEATAGGARVHAETETSLSPGLDATLAAGTAPSPSRATAASIIPLTSARVAFLAIAALCAIDIVYFVVRFILSGDPPLLHASFRGTTIASEDPFAASGIFYGPQLTLARVALVATTFLVLACWVAFRHRRDTLVQIVSLLCAVGGQYSMAVAVLTSSEDHPLWRGMAAVLYIAVPAGAMVFLALFPSGRPVPRWSLAVVPVALIPFVIQCVDMVVYRAYSVPVAAAMFLATSSFLGFQRYRYRRSSLREQHQIRWLSFAGVAFLSIQVIAVVAVLPLLHDPARPGFQLLKLLYEFLLLASYFVALASLLFSAARYRLWDIDRVINRTIVDAVVTLLLGAAATVAFFALDASLRGALETSGTVSAAVSFAIAVILFAPMRRRIARWIDRRFYGIGLDYEGLVAKAVRATQLALPTTTTAFGAYDELVLLGRGGMGAVYRAHHPEFGVEVALKVMSPALADERDAQARFLREAQVLETLVHPNIVPYLASGHDHGLAFIAMQYIEGEDLAAVLRSRRRLTLEEALPILDGIAAALDFAHGKGVIHRDLKPANILLEGRPTDALSTRSPRVMDFGVAHLVDAPGNADDDSLVGSLHYIAPEQIQHPNRVDARADIYSLAATTYELLTGRTPFREATALGLVMAHLRQPPDDPREHEPTIPAVAAAAVIKGLEKAPEKRFATASAFVGALRQVQA